MTGAGRPAIRFRGAVLGTDDGHALAAFYERFLGWPIAHGGGPGGWALLEAPAGGLKIEIQPEEGYVRPRWPGVEGEQQMQVHLDFAVADLEAAVAWAIECGAVVAEHQPQANVRVLLDPAGHPFCLFVGSV